MKKQYLLFAFIVFLSFTQAQIINFTDIEFKNALLAHVPNIDTNFDNEIDIVEASMVFDLDVSNKNIISIDGIENFINLNTLNCSMNGLTSLEGIQSLPSLLSLNCSTNGLSNMNEVSDLVSLDSLNCSDNFNILSVNVSQLSQLTVLNCSFTSISSLDVSQNTMLWDLNCSNCFLTTIDVMSNYQLEKLNVQSNQLESMFIKNGNESLVNGGNFYLAYNPNLNYICTDDSQVENVAFGWAVTNNVSPFTYLDRVNSYCTFVPGGGSYVIEGKSNYDGNSNGCDVNDPIIPNLNFVVDNGSASGNYVSNASGNYSIAVPEGVYTITPVLNSYFTITPNTFTVNFPSDASPFLQDFCVIPNGTYNDLEISILPLELARPGFDTTYSIMYQNNGTTTLSGDVNLNFNDDLVDYLSANSNPDTINIGELIWSYTDLKPFEKREILFTVNTNTPTDPNFPLNNGDILNYTASITPSVSDETPENNLFELNQTVVNSYDPNDKTCLEGKTILPSEVGDYVTYIIRFENNGTASAVNIVVKDVIDTAKYDMSSLTVLKGSHDFRTKIRETNIVEFIFENINLPFDDAINDGYVSFKIKTQPTLVENDTFENEAEIYFDYNPAIITNLEQTKIESALGVSDYQLDNSISYYPNPVKNTLFINSKNNINHISFYDINGRLILNTPVTGNMSQEKINVAELAHGVYFIKINSSKGVLIDKIIID